MDIEPHEPHCRSVMAESVISSALSSAPDDLVEPSLFARGLPPSSSASVVTESTDNTVGLDLARLPGFEKVPLAKRSRSSWIWEHGYELSKKDGTRWWVCRICHRAKVSNSIKPYIYNARSTANAAAHMKRWHPDVDDVHLRRDEGQAPTVIDQLRRSKESTLVTPFSTQQFKSSFLEWIIRDDLTFRQAASERLRRLLTLANPLITPILPQSHTTVSSWIQQLYEVKKSDVRELLAGTDARINISFDLWTSDNHLPLAAIIAHFIGKDNCL